jgi:predicted amidohydrolase YtcJ
MSRDHRWPWTCILLFLLALGSCSRNNHAGVPNLILVHGRIFTGNESHPYAEAVAIQGPRILTVGTNQQILSLAGKARQIDLAGRLVIPGINDGHVHFDEDPQSKFVDFGAPDPACAKVEQKLRQAVRKAPTGDLLTGTIGPSAFFDSQCTPATLDRIAPEDSVLLWTPTLHAAILNQQATRKFGIRVKEPPVLGGWFGKDMRSPRWDGVVHEYAWFRIFAMLPADISAGEARLRNFLSREAQWGVTSITLIEPKPGRRVAMLSDIDPAVRVRVVPAPFTDGNGRLKPESVAVPQRLSDRVSVSGLKWWLDGSPFERSSAMRAPYADDPKTSGQINFTPEEVRSILQEAGQQKSQLLLHAVGDRTAETLLREMEATGGEAVWPPRRLRIEHGDGLLPDLIPRVSAVGAIVVQNPTHLQGRELFVQRFGGDRVAIQSPFRSLLSAKIKLVLASDAAAGEPELNPYLNIMLACDYPGKPQESLRREEAVLAYTRTAAYAEQTEDRKGTLEPGKLADLAVLSQDIFRISEDLLPKTESVLTMVNGRIIYTNGVSVKQ